MSTENNKILEIIIEPSGRNTNFNDGETSILPLTENVQPVSNITDNQLQVTDYNNERNTLHESRHFWYGSGGEFRARWGQCSFICCPYLSLFPAVSTGRQIFDLNDEISVKSERSGCWIPFLNGKQRIKIGFDHPRHGFMEKLSFVFTPKIWCCKSQEADMVHIFSSEQEEPLGWILPRNGSFIERADIGTGEDGVPKFVAMHDKHAEQLGVKVSTVTGSPVALANVTRWIRYYRTCSNHWREFTLHLPRQETLLISDTERTVLLGFFVFWILKSQEKNMKKNWLILLSLQLLGVIVALIIIYGSADTNSRQID